MQTASAHASHPQFSVIFSVRDQVEAVRENLPTVLTQQCESGYEVIVVDECSTDGTPDVVSLLCADHPHLYSTFLPRSQHQLARRRLALSLGVKAAKGQWLVFADIDTPPASAEWLQELTPFMAPPTQLLLGYYDPKTGDVRLQQFDDIDEAAAIISKAERLKGTGRKGKRLRYKRGMYDFVVVPASLGHETLRLFERDIRGWRLFCLRLRVFLYNLFH